LIDITLEKNCFKFLKKDCYSNVKILSIVWEGTLGNQKFPNLEELHVGRPNPFLDMDLRLKNAPHLKTLSVGDLDRCVGINQFPTITSLAVTSLWFSYDLKLPEFPYIKSLTIHRSPSYAPKLSIYLLSNFPNLKDLTWVSMTISNLHPSCLKHINVKLLNKQ
jgi:hypothetical protein